MKKVLVISASMRKDGNSYRLARAFEKGARDAGHDVEFADLRDKTLNFCRGCYACEKTQRCYMHDDADAVTEKMREADVLVFATPVYAYNICGSLKTLMDRCNPAYFGGYRFREVYALISAAQNNDRVRNAVERAIQGFVDVFKKSRFMGSVFAGGIDRVGDIEGHPALEEAYRAGRSIS